MLLHILDQPLVAGIAGGLIAHALLVVVRQIRADFQACTRESD